MRVRVIADFVAVVVLALEDFRIFAGLHADDEERSRNVFLFQDVENLRRPARIGTVVKRDGEFFLCRAKLVDVVREWDRVVIFVGEKIGLGVVGEAALAALWSIDEPPDIAVAFENKVRTGRDVDELLTHGVVGAGRVPDAPDRGVGVAEAEQHRALHAEALAGAQLVVASDGIEHPDLVLVIVFVDVGVTRVERGIVEIDVGFGFEGVEQSFLHAKFCGGSPLLVVFARPVVGEIRDADDDFLGRDLLHHLMEIFDKPILSGDRAWRRRNPVLIEIKQNDRVALFAEEFVIVGVVTSRQFDHQFQTDSVEGRAEFGDELSKIGLRLIGDGLEIDDDAGLVRLDGVFDDLADEAMPCLLIRQQLHHFVDAPDLAVIVVEQTHDRQLDVGGLHPAMEFVVFEQRDRFFWRSLHRLIALVIDDRKLAVGSDGVELLGNQDVEIFVVALE